MRCYWTHFLFFRLEESSRSDRCDLCDEKTSACDDSAVSVVHVYMYCCSYTAASIISLVFMFFRSRAILGSSGLDSRADEYAVGHAAETSCGLCTFGARGGLRQGAGEGGTPTTGQGSKRTGRGGLMHLLLATHFVLHHQRERRFQNFLRICIAERASRSL